jgi:hypothetical protein
VTALGAPDSGRSTGTARAPGGELDDGSSRLPDPDTGIGAELERPSAAQTMPRLPTPVGWLSSDPYAREGEIRAREGQAAANYKPGLGRKIGGTLVEILGALGRNPELYDMGQGIKTGPLRKQLEPMEAQLGQAQAEEKSQAGEMTREKTEAQIEHERARTSAENLRGQLTGMQIDALKTKPGDQVGSPDAQGQVFVIHPDGSYEFKDVPGWKAPPPKGGKIDPVAAAIGGEPQGSTWGAKDYGTPAKAQAAYGRAYEAEQRKQKAIEAQTAADIGVTAASRKAELPTSTTRTMQEAAPKVTYLVDRIGPLIDQLSGQLGPTGGRWSEFWAGKVGAPGPQFTKLRTDVGLLQTQLMRMHVGARGGEYIMKKFQDLIDSGKQSPENMKAALEEIRAYAQDVAGRTPSQAGPAKGKGKNPFR